MRKKIQAGAFKSNSSSDCNRMKYCDDHEQQKTVKQTFNDSDEEDRVNHPSHYTWLKEKCGIEVIDITRHMGFDLGNVVKYVLRAGHKEEADMTLLEKQIEDLEKAAWYLNDEITQLKLNLQK